MASRFVATAEPKGSKDLRIRFLVFGLFEVYISLSYQDLHATYVNERILHK